MFNFPAHALLNLYATPKQTQDKSRRTVHAHTERRDSKHSIQDENTGAAVLRNSVETIKPIPS